MAENDFEVRSIRLYNEEDYHILSTHHLLSEAKAARKLSGDLIYFKGKLVLTDTWLFDWEKKDKQCFARKMINIAKDKQTTPQPQMQKTTYKTPYQTKKPY